MSTDTIEFAFLIDRQEWVPLVIDWWATKWRDRMSSDLERDAEFLRNSLKKDDFPIHIVATRDGEPVGSAALKFRELPDLFPQHQFWLGSVFTAPAQRGQGIASALCNRIIEIARERGHPHLFLQTENLGGGLYRKLGWQPITEFSYRDQQTLLMKKMLDS